MVVKGEEEGAEVWVRGEGEDQSYIGSLKYKKKCGEGIRQTERKH